MSNNVMYKGLSFKSESDLARYLGISRQLYSKRKLAGYSEDDIGKPPGSFKSSYHRRPVKYRKIRCAIGPDGDIFDSIKSMCDFYNVSYRTFNYRKSKGFTIEECLGIVKRDDRKNKKSSYKGSSDIGSHVYLDVNYEGIHFDTVKSICEYYNISPILFLSRYRKGYSISLCLKKGRLSKGEIMRDKMGLPWKLEL